MPQRLGLRSPTVGDVRHLPVILAVAVLALLGGVVLLHLPASDHSSGSTAPTIKDDDFGTVTVYSINDDGSLDPEPTGLALEVWQTFERIVTPHFAANVISQYRVGDSDSSDTYAYVYQTFDQRYWVLADNLATSGDHAELVATLVHEYAHILTLQQDEMRPGRETCATVDLD